MKMKCVDLNTCGNAPFRLSWFKQMKHRNGSKTKIWSARLGYYWIILDLNK